jgi:hypothetical protein
MAGAVEPASSPRVSGNSGGGDDHGGGGSDDGAGHN